MRVITERGLIAGVAKAWKRQYLNEENSIYRQLLHLDKQTATADDVAAIIGNRSWTTLDACGECGEVPHDALVQIGAEYVCLRCLRKAIEMTEDVVNRTTPHPPEAR